MTPYKPDLNEQHVLEAKLNTFFGADVYDKYFLGFEMVEVNDDVLRAWARTEHSAAVIQTQYSEDVAWIAGTLLNQHIKRLCVLVRGMKHGNCKQPT